MKLLFRILALLYSIIFGLILILLFPILYILERLNLEPNWLYHTNTMINIWLASKYLKKM